MSHPAQMRFISNVKNALPRYFTGAKVLEVGSLNINGTVRQLFDNCDYTGLDVAPGDCVDVVCEGNKYDAPDNTFDTVISAECFEHNKYWKETFVNMHRMCKPSGLVIFTCATTDRPEHGTRRTSANESATSAYEGWEDYYRNLTVFDFERKLNMVNMFGDYCFIINSHDKDIYFYGLKKEPLKTFTYKIS